MELIDRRAKVYGPPATLTACEDEIDIRASYGPNGWEKHHDCFVRGVRVSKLRISETAPNGKMYTWCLFPDGRIMLVGEGNITAKKSPPPMGVFHGPKKSRQT